jgi:hypothetical protein
LSIASPGPFIFALVFPPLHRFAPGQIRSALLPYFNGRVKKGGLANLRRQSQLTLRLSQFLAVATTSRVQDLSNVTEACRGLIKDLKQANAAFSDNSIRTNPFWRFSRAANSVRIFRDVTNMRRPT